MSRQIIVVSKLIDTSSSLPSAFPVEKSRLFRYFRTMRRDEVITKLKEAEPGRSEQRHELKAFIRRNAAVGHKELCRRVQARFGVRYSPRYVGQVAKETVGKS